MEAHKPYAATGLSFEQFLKQFDSVRAEYLMGNVMLLPPVTVQHQEILSFLACLFNLWLDEQTGQVFLHGYVMRISDDVPVRAPDLLIVLKEHCSRILFSHLEGAADIVIEISTEWTVAQDRGVKFTEYEAAGVREYWLFNPTHQEADIYALQDNGRFRRLEKDHQGRIASALLPGFALDPAILWRDQLPDGEALIALAREMTKQR